MTNPTPHGQVPEALEDHQVRKLAAIGAVRTSSGLVERRPIEYRRELEDQFVRGFRAAEKRLSALSAAPEAFLKSVIALCSHRGYSPANIEAWDKDDKWIADLWRQAESMLAASPTPPAEQQATKETSGGFHVWRDISTAPKDGSRFVATGHNYGLYSEVRHTCVAQWFRGCWMEVSDWNETSELKYLTHWMPLPSPPDDVAAPAEQQAAPKAAPAQQAGEAAESVPTREHDLQDVRCECCGYMTYHREHMGCIHAARKQGEKQ